jgi:N-acetylmuramoyl-L-alanine amidase
MKSYGGLKDKMGWKIVAASEAPLGKRVLRNGSVGKDVLEAQQLLADSGFYLGDINGLYGILTEEAVAFFQKTFSLKRDGILGFNTLAALKKVSTKPIRIIHTVKPGENLEIISKRFGVAKSAWQSLSGQGNPERKIYPGMKLLLNQKVVLCSGKRDESFPATAGLNIGWEIKADGELVRTKKTNGAGTFETLSAQPEDWAKVLVSDKDWEKIAVNFKQLSLKNWGIDFSNAPPETIFRWGELLHYLCNALAIKQIPLIIILLPVNEVLRNRIFRINLSKLSKLVNLLIIEPSYAVESPETFLKSGTNLVRALRKIVNYNNGMKTLLMGRVGGWDWNLDQGGRCRQVSFREARLLAAMNYRFAKYNRESFFTVVRYLRHQERHCLIFRDQQGWQDWIKIGARFNLLGFTIQDGGDLGKFGSDLVIRSFGVIPEERL